MSLEDFGVTSRESLRDVATNQHGEKACPVCSNPIGHTEDVMEIPVRRLADDDLRDRLEDLGRVYVRSRGWQCHVDDLLLPRTVSGPKAAGFASSTWAGVRAQFGDGSTGWVPVLNEDLPDVPLEELDDLDDASDERTRVGMWMEDDCDVYAGRAKSGESNLLNTEPGDRGWLGNPYSVERFGREQAIAMYTHAVLHRCEQDVEFRNALGDLQGTGTVLGCWCRRLEDDEPACHCDVLVRVIDDVLVPRNRNGGEDA
ncbi:DUF4326 domain-containing protein [Halomontanus rarus]|uniref:DUF4326 domain-containing protein n=1 Tax=Halomontanus rarus TaxID=3034020 RepID=UPI0023E883B8|nr:DUF4326 domain-containing protein [Halovivax sp. TS33]